MAVTYTLLAFLLASLSGGTSLSSGAQSLHFSQDFEQGDLHVWEFPYPEDWEIREEAGNRFLHMRRSRPPAEPRRPVQFARLQGVKAGSFELRLRVRRHGRSVLVVFNYVDSRHFYYAHLSQDRGTDVAVHNGLFIVDGGPRRRLAGEQAPAALPGRDWRRVRLVRDTATGRIEVFIGEDAQPLFSAVDRTFGCGQVGVGSFDETGDFDDLELRGEACACTPAEGATP